MLLRLYIAGRGLEKAQRRNALEGGECVGVEARAGPRALQPSPAIPKQVRDILVKARSSWLRNTEVCDLLEHYAAYGFDVSNEPPEKPPGKP